MGDAILRQRFCHGFRLRPVFSCAPSQRRRIQMFGIGYQEMFVLLVVSLVVFGPARLPELAGQVGRWVRDFRRMSSDLTGEFQSTFSEIDEVKKSFERELKSAAGELDSAGKSVSGKKPAAAKPATAAKTA